MNKELVKSRSSWECLIEDWSKSGLPQEEFCRQRGVSYGNFSKARGRLLKRGFGPPASRSGGKKPIKAEFAHFIPVSVEDSPSVAVPEIVIELPLGVVIRFRGFQP